MFFVSGVGFCRISESFLLCNSLTVDPTALADVTGESLVEEVLVDMSTVEEVVVDVLTVEEL